MTDSITLRRPDDWHLHLRDGAMLAAVAPHSADFGRALIMPNLVPPVVTADQAAAYRDRIRAALPPGAAMQPQMTLYLTEATDPADVLAGQAAGVVRAVKLYPAGATTNSASGVRDFDRVRPVLEAMAGARIPLCIHGEVTDPAVDIFDREAVFLDRVLDPLRRATPGLRVVLEHVTTKDGVDYVRAGGPDLGGTLTVHHLAVNRNAMLAGGIRPHFYCLPILKRQTHQQTLLEVATSGNPKFFLGTDSAPHSKNAKENACGCAGCYSAPTAIELYAQAFDQVGKLERLEGFASHFGADFYGLPRNTSTITLVKEDQVIPESLDYLDGEQIIPLYAGKTIQWRKV